MNAISEYISENPEQTTRFAAALAARCKSGDVIALSGDLGSGKTAFARGFIQSLLTTPEEVVSPTFTLLQHYTSRNKTAIFHFDLYRLKTLEDVWNIGMEEALSSGIALIEWPELVAGHLPKSALFIQITTLSDIKRRFGLGSADGSWQSRLAQLSMDAS